MIFGAGVATVATLKKHCVHFELGTASSIVSLGQKFVERDRENKLYFEHRNVVICRVIL